MTQGFPSSEQIWHVRNVLDLLALSPGRLLPAIVLLGNVVLLNDLIRTALMVSFTRSVLNHVVVVILTLFPAVFIGAVLLYAGYRYPDRAWSNLLFAVLFYVIWYVGGSSTRLARRDTEGADVGFMAVGSLITLPCGVIAILAF